MAGVQAVVAVSRHAFPRHTHDQFGIGVIHRGAQRSASGRGPVEAGPGDVITVNPGEVHDGAAIGDSGRAWRMLYFDPPAIEAAILDLTEGRTGAFEFSDPVLPDPATARCFGRLFRALVPHGATGPETSDASALRAEELLSALLARMTRRRNVAASGQATPAALAIVRALIDDDPAAPVTLADLACASGLSRFQVLRGFVKTTGLTPHAYLVQRRVDAARRMIAQGMPLAETAVASGFADQSHMTRAFVRRYGITPGAFAAALR